MEQSVIRQLPRAIMQQRKVVMPIVGIGAALALLALFFVHTKYVAVASVLAVDSSAQPSNDTSGLAAAKQPIMVADLPALVSSTQVLERIQHDLHNAVDIVHLRGGIRTGLSTGSAVIHLQFTSKNPRLAIAVTNAAAHEVAAAYQQMSTQRYDSLIADLNRQLGALRNRLADLDSQLDAGAKQYPFVDVHSGSSSGISVYDRLTQLRSQHDDATAAIQADESSLTASSALVNNAKPVAERDLVENDPVYHNLSTQYATDLQSLQHIQSFSNSNYPGLEELKQTVERESQAVNARRMEVEKNNLTSNTNYSNALDTVARAKAQLASDRARLAAIDSERSELESNIGQGSIANDISRIRRDRANTDAAYQAFSARLSEARADRAQAAATGSLMVLDYANEAYPQQLSSGKSFAIGILFITLWFAGSVALFLNQPEQNMDAGELARILRYHGNVQNVTYEDLPLKTGH